MASGRRHYFHVADQVGHERWGNDTLAMMVRLMAHLHERWARDGLSAEAAGSCELNRADVMRISGKHRLDVARTWLSRGADVASMSVEHHADFSAIHWPKFPDFQGLATRKQGVIGPKNVAPVTDTDTDTDTDTIKKKRRNKTSAQNGAASEERSVNWITAAGKLWEKHCQGKPQWGRLGKALKPVVDEVGEQVFLIRWERYLAENEPQFATPERFASQQGLWADRAEENKPPLTYGCPHNPHCQSGDAEAMHAIMDRDKAKRTCPYEDPEHPERQAPLDAMSQRFSPAADQPIVHRHWGTL